ncbi:sensor histidine kinase [Solibacillus silvestris]|uniref:sensor histidine kinase n=1 Tax=Solibacillus silvestris TaxID=76853 RepID=UPI003F7FF878
MTVKEYVKDRSLFLLANFILFIVLCGILLLTNMGSSVILPIFCIWFFPVLTYMMIEFFRQKMFYNELSSILDSLDQKYLLSEVMKEPETVEGKLLYDVLRQVDKDMHEHVKSYKERENEYREYIEAWVHEIKTPIASSRLIIANNPNAVTRNIQDEIKKIEEYIEQVLYYSRSNHVGKDYLIKEIPLADLVRTVIKRNSRDFISKGIIVDMEAVAGMAYSDAKWLEFIVNQLIGNAIKYTPEHHGKVTIHTARNENNIVLTIEDNGIGITKKDIDRVFEKGFTGENGRKFGGSTGIGLYLCKKLAEQLGLGLTLTSKAGEGTKVSLTFPLGSVSFMQ